MQYFKAHWLEIGGIYIVYLNNQTISPGSRVYLS